MQADVAIRTLHEEISWLQEVINQVICSYLLHEGHEKHWLDIPIPPLDDNDSPYANMVRDWHLNVFDRLAIALNLCPHLRPEVLDIFFGKNKMYDRGFTEFGGLIDNMHSGFLPTGQTLCFLMASRNPELHYAVMDVLGSQSTLIKEQVILLGDVEPHLPKFNGVLSLSNVWLHYFLTGEKLGVEEHMDFPAQRISTKMDWEDLVLNDRIINQITEIDNWLKYGEEIMNNWGLDKILKPGYRALFYGPPGTGKTLTATLLGKSSGFDVYRIDLSMVVSKYIGETEKNLARIFDIAQHKNWILFFDEADALFGKRTANNSSNDRHANQQTAYLLQRIENFPGVAILASNLKSNMDEAFVRRFQSIIHFEMPSADERFQIWKNAFSGKCTLDTEIDLWEIAESYELSGGSIINVLRSCSLTAISQNRNVVKASEFLFNIKKEFKKENKTIDVLS